MKADLGVDYRLAGVLECRQRLAWDWRRALQGVIYQALGDAGAELHRARYSLFTYALTPFAAAADEAGLRSRTGMWHFAFASAVPEVLEAVEGFMREECGFSLGSAGFRLHFLCREAVVDGPRGLAGSVLLISRDRSGFLAPGEPDFEEALVGALAARWKWCGGDPDALAGLRVRLDLPCERKLAQYCGRNLLCFSGQVTIEGRPEVRRFARLVGLGHKPSCGFGYLF